MVRGLKGHSGSSYITITPSNNDVVVINSWRLSLMEQSNVKHYIRKTKI